MYVRLYYSLFSKIFAFALRILALFLLPEPSQMIYQKMQTILKIFCTNLNWEHYENALIQAEDHRFYFHQGVDCIAITRAFYQTLRHGCRQGGSTIEQQLVRTLTGDYRRNLNRKIRELLLASTLSHDFSKREVLRAYLCVAYFGENIVGLQQAINKINDFMEADVCPVAYLIAHLRYPKPKRAKDHSYFLRLRRTKIIMHYCESLHFHSFLFTRKMGK